MAFSFEDAYFNFCRELSVKSILKSQNFKLSTLIFQLIITRLSYLPRNVH